jgi:aminoglycoside 6'-N-acetyltransferase
VSLTFRRLSDDDLPMLHRWLNDPAVVRWWEGEDVSEEAVVRSYGADDEPTEHWIALLEGEPLGWIQCYAWADDPEGDETKAHWSVGVDRTAGGIDYLLGDAGDRGRGLGARMIRSFVEDVVFPEPPAVDPGVRRPVRRQRGVVAGARKGRLPPPRRPRRRGRGRAVPGDGHGPSARRLTLHPTGDGTALRR